MVLADRDLAIRDALAERRVAGDALLADAGQLRNADRRIADRAHRARLHAAIIHRPLADAEFAEADLDIIAILRRQPLERPLGAVEFGDLLFPILEVEADDEIGLAERGLVQGEAKWMLVRKIERVVDVPDARARGLGEFHHGLEPALAPADI